MKIVFPETNKQIVSNNNVETRIHAKTESRCRDSHTRPS